MTTTPARRPQRPQIVLEVIERIPLSPHLVRIVAGGPGMSGVEANTSSDAYAKMLFAQPGSGVQPPYDVAALREELPREQLPAVRTYTIRRFDLEAGHLWIDFVVHGSEGIAGAWAATAEPGDAVVIAGIGGGYSPDPSADWHLLVGDESALPAIASALEALPAHATGVALLECGGPDDELELIAPVGVEVRWLHRGAATAGTSDVLIEAVRRLTWREGRVHGFVHGERESMRQLRRHLTDERGLERGDHSISAYWAYGRKEDAFQAEKREAIGQI